MMKVKICGIKEERDMLTAFRYGADAVGFVSGFKGSPRNITLAKVNELSRKAPVFSCCVLVTNGKTVVENFSVIKNLDISAVQLYDASEELVYMLKDNGINIIHPVRRNEKSFSKVYDAYLVDSYNKEKAGGTGILVDFEYAKRIKEAVYPKPVILAGGLTPDNVEQAILAVKPYAVDVSSGVETYPGKKDPKKVLDFIRKAKGLEV